MPSAQVTEWDGRGQGREKKKEKCTDKSEHRRKRIQGLLPLTGSILCTWDGGTVGRRTEVKSVGERGEEKGSI